MMVATNRRWEPFRLHGGAAMLIAIALSSTAFGMANNSVITAPASADFGRVLLGQTDLVNVTLTKTGNGNGSDTTYTATVTPANNGITVTATGSFAEGDQTEVITFNLQNNANGSGTTTGVKGYTVVVDNTATTSNGAGQGTLDPNNSIAVAATVVANRDLTGGPAAALGRVMLGVNTLTGATTVLGGAADDNNATRVNLINGSVSSGGVTVTRSGGTFLFDAASESAGVNVVGNFATTGSKSGPINVASLLTNGEAGTFAGTPTVDISVLVDYTATAVDNRDLSGGPTANLGRVMVGFSSTPAVNTTVLGGIADDNNATRVNLNNGSVSSGGVTVTRSGGTFLFDAASESAGVDVAGNFGTAGAQSGSVNVASLLSNGETAITGTPTVDSSVLINFTATAVNNRTVNASAVDLGKVFVNSTSNSASAILNSAVNTDDTLTRVTLAAGPEAVSVVDGLVTLGAGAAYQYGAANDAVNSTTRNVSGAFTDAGAKSGTANFSLTPEGLSNESVNPIALDYEAEVYDRSTASFDSIFADTKLIDFGTVQQNSIVPSEAFSIFNLLATAGFTADLELDSIIGSGDTGVLTTNLVPFTAALALAAGNSSNFDAFINTSTAGSFSATYLLTFTDQDDITGAVVEQTLTLTLQATVAVIPEPSTFVMLLAGVTGLLAMRRQLTIKRGVAAK